MGLVRLVGVAVAAVVLGGAALAQGMHGTVPAEFPPAGFRGAVFIDSTGCAFRRAGDGAGGTRWHPQRARDGSQLCGYAPSVIAPAVDPAPDVVAQDAVSAPAKPKPRRKAQPAATPRYVQVGVFADPVNAQAAKQRIWALDLPVSVAHGRKGAKQLQAVLIGPFDTRAALRDALVQARGAGFADAFLR